MALPESNPDLYQHVRVVISIIVGLCVTTLLSGFSRFVQHPKRDKVSMLHLGWAASLLLSIIHFWWWEFRLALVRQWTFAIYFFVILYAILFYSLCTLLFPSDLRDSRATKSIFSLAANGSLDFLRPRMSPISSTRRSKGRPTFIPSESNTRSELHWA